MRFLAFSAALALTSCVQPPASSVPAAVQTSAPDLAPRYPSWDEIPASTQPTADTHPPAATEPPVGTPLIGGASLLHQTIHHNGRSSALQCVLFDSRSYTLQVVDQPADWSGGSKISESMRSVNAIAGVNGGFFTPQFAPMGLMIANGHQTGSWQQNKLLSGAVVVRQQPQLLWNAEVRDARSAQHLIQAGPRLVDAGHAVPNLERRKHVTRTFIATDGAHRWIIGLARDISLGELAELLATPRTFPDGFHVHRALNLDGGHSSAFYYRSADGQEHADPGWSTVRNYLGIVPR